MDKKENVLIIKDSFTAFDAVNFDKINDWLISFEFDLSWIKINLNKNIVLLLNYLIFNYLFHEHILMALDRISILILLLWIFGLWRVLCAGNFPFIII